MRGNRGRKVAQQRRKEAAELLALKAALAVRVQARVRGVAGRARARARARHVFRCRMATKIASLARGRRARARFGPLLERWRAATRIQGLFRIRKSRFTVKNLLRLRRIEMRLNGAQDIQRVWWGHLGRKVGRYHRRRRDAATTVQRVLYRGRKGRAKAAYHRARRGGAVDLQRLWRGHVARRWYVKIYRYIPGHRRRMTGLH